MRTKRHPDIAPTHPGEIIVMGLDETGITRLALAGALGISRNTLYKLLDGRQAVTAEMALWLEAVWGSTAPTWLNLQADYDLWHARRRLDTSDLRRLQPSSPIA